MKSASAVNRYLSSFLILLLICISFANTAYIPIYTNSFFDFITNAQYTELPFESRFELWGKYDIASLTYWLNYKLGGATLAGYHGFNVLIHLINAALIYALVIALLKRCPVDHSPLQGKRIALLTASLFILIPINVQTVSLIDNRDVLLDTFFYLSVLVLWLKIEKLGEAASLLKLGYLFLLLVTTTVAFIFTEQSLSIILSIITFCVVSNRFRSREYLSTIVVAIGLVVLLIQLGGFLLEADSINVASSILGSASWQYLSHQLVATGIYLTKFIVPFPLLLEYNITPYTWQDDITWLALLAHAVVITLGYVKRRSYPLISLLIVLFYATLVQNSSVFSSDVLTLESRFYLPSIFVCLILAYALFACLQKYQMLHLTLPIAMLVGCTFGNYYYTNLLSQPIKYYQHNLRYTEDNSRAYGAVALNFTRQGAHPSNIKKWNKIMLQESDRTGYLDSAMVFAIMNALIDGEQHTEAKRLGTVAAKQLTNNEDKAELNLLLAQVFIADSNCRVARGLLNKARTLGASTKKTDYLLDSCDAGDVEELQ